MRRIPGIPNRCNRKSEKKHFVLWEFDFISISILRIRSLFADEDAFVREMTEEALLVW